MQEKPEIQISSGNALAMSIPASGWQGEGGAVTRDEEATPKRAEEAISGPRESRGDFYHRVVQACLALITAGVVLIGVATVGFFWNRQGRQESVVMPAQSASLAQAPAQVEAIPLNSAPASTQAARGDVGTSSFQGASLALTGAEVGGLVSELRSGPAPRDCASAVRQLVAERHVAGRQAQDVARQAFPELCAASASAQAASSSAPVAVSSGSPPPAERSSVNVDAIYQTRTKAECSASGFDHFCMSRVRNSLCEGLYSSDPPPGQFVCKK